MVNLLIISHGEIGQALLDTARQMLACCPRPLPTQVVSIDMADSPDSIRRQLNKAIMKFEQVGDILILTDMFGSTPSNIACALSNQHDIAIVSGLNLPMLIRIFNYPDLSLSDLTQKAMSAGTEGVTLYPQLTHVS